MAALIISSRKYFFMLNYPLNGGYSMQQFAYKIVQDPFSALSNYELKLSYDFYRSFVNYQIFMQPCDHIFLTL